MVHRTCSQTSIPRLNVTVPIYIERHSYSIKTTLYSKNNARANNRLVSGGILGGAAAWDNVDKTSAVCKSCSYHEVYFIDSNTSC